MSRSKKKNPMAGYGVCRSEKHDKREWHKRLRSKERDKIRTGDFDDIPDIKEVSNPWTMGKDGKMRFDPDEWPEGMRK